MVEVELVEVGGVLVRAMEEVVVIVVEAVVKAVVCHGGHGGEGGRPLLVCACGRRGGGCTGCRNIDQPPAPALLLLWPPPLPRQRGCWCFLCSIEYRFHKRTESPL